MTPHTAIAPQPGIFAFGTPAHAYLEFDRRGDVTSLDLISGAIRAAEGLSSGRALSIVIGFRPELWRDAVPNGCPAELAGFDQPVVGPDGFSMPGTQRDVIVWIAGAGYDAIFDSSQELIDDLADTASLVSDVHGWHYRQNRDLTGFVDGTENPSPIEAPGLVLIDSADHAGGCVLLVQQWMHDPRWRTLPVAEQQAAIGRTKDTDEELNPRPDTSHVARTDQDTFGHILRRNTGFGTPEKHGTMFVGFAATQKVLAAMLDSMAGIDTPRDALTRYAAPISGSYYYVPSLGQLRTHLPAGD